MPEVTPHLGLTIIDPETDGNIYFDVKKHLGDNFLKIDEQFGGTPISVNVMSGTGIYNVVRDGKLRITELKGRTLVNMLGRAGNCEMLNDWAVARGTYALDTVHKVVGNNSIKITISSGNTDANIYRNIFSRLDKSKHYIAVASLKNGNGSGGMQLMVSFVNGTNQITSRQTDTTLFKTAYVKIKPSDMVNATDSFIEAYVFGSAGQYGYVDAIRLYEITAEKYNALSSMTIEQIEREFPYNDDMKPIFYPYLIAPGRNLASPFTDWSIHANAKIISPYDLELNSTAASQATTFEGFAVPSATYNLSGTVSGGTPTAGGYLTVGWFNKNGSLIRYENSYFTGEIDDIITAPSDAYTYKMYATCDAVTGKFTFSNIMLNVGQKIPFEPQNRTYQYIQTELRSNPNGTEADELTYDETGRLSVLRKHKAVVLDGSLPWTFVDDLAGFKRLALDNYFTNFVADSQIVVKFDGKILFNCKTEAWASDYVQLSGTALVISVPDSENGWGENWAGTGGNTSSGKAYTAQQLMQAYFNGWKYRGGTNPAWISLGDNASTSDDPLYVSTNIAPGYTPPRIQFQLLKPVMEPVQTEGEIILHEGENQITLGAGVIVREVVTPVLSGVSYFINERTLGSSFLDYRTDRILGLYRDSEEVNITSDLSDWRRIGNDGWSNGNERLVVLATLYKEGAYSVTYTALDMYKLGFAPSSINSEYEGNAKEQLKANTVDIAGLRTMLDVVLNTFARRQQSGWITPTLLNGWRDLGGYDPIGYRVDEFGEVHFRGCATGGDPTKAVFILPARLRPKTMKYWSALGNNGTTDVQQTIGVKPDGSVTVGNATRSFLFNSSFLPDA
jgi:hypothetical protein